MILYGLFRRPLKGYASGQAAGLLTTITNGRVGCRNGSPRCMNDTGIL